MCVTAITRLIVNFDSNIPLLQAGATDDIRHAMLWISKTFPGSAVYGLGEGPFIAACGSYVIFQAFRLVQIL